MAYDLTALTAAAAHAAGHATFDTGNSGAIMVNQALGEFNNYPWTWRQKTTTRDLTSGQNYVALPSDFTTLIALRGGSNTRTVPLPTTVSRIMQMRSASAGTVAGGSQLFYAVDQTGQASGTVAATFKLQVYPTPAATVAEGLQLHYLRQIPELSSGTSVADIPGHLFPVLLTLVRGYAELYESNNPAGCWQVGHEMLMKAQERDAMTQPNLGRLRGSVGDHLRGGGGDERFATDVAVTV